MSYEVKYLGAVVGKFDSYATAKKAAEDLLKIVIGNAYIVEPNGAEHIVRQEYQESLNLN